jgi:uncharacterized membrane protein
MGSPLDKVLHPNDQTRIVDAIKQAERLSSGEIKVHVEGRCPGGDPQKRAAELFVRLGLKGTRERNGVLIYAATRDGKFAIFGDTAVEQAVGATYRADALQALTKAFRRNAFGDGIVAAVQAIGKKLAPKFPRAADDVNEIDNDISTDEKNS